MRKLASIAPLFLIALILNACGVGVDLQTAQPAATTTNEVLTTAAQLSPEDMQATIAAQVEATLAARQAPATVTPAGTETTAATETPTAQETAVAATETLPTPVATNPEAATPCPPTSTAQVAPASAATATAAPPPALLLILDSSGSMLLDDGAGRRKIDTAKDALKALVDALPQGAPVGLRVYGHRVPNTDKANGCQDTELIVPIGPLDPQAMKTKIDSFQAVGWTPISTSLEQAAQDLPPEGERTIVLVSDGEETCDRDPCQTATDLIAKGINVKVETVGFRVDANTRGQLECIARATGGAYHDVSNAQDLSTTLQQVSSRALKTYQTIGSVVQGGDSFNNPPVLEAGQYQDSIKVDETLFYAVNLEEGQRLRVTTTMVGQPDVGMVKSIGAFLTLKVYDPNRQEGGLDNEANIGHETVSLALNSDPVAQAGQYYFSINLRQNGEGLGGREFQTEIIVEIVGAGAADPCPSPDEGALTAQQPAALGPVQGGGSFNDATLLQAGTFQDTIKVGETLFYAVNLAAGQRLRVTATLTGQPDVQLPDSVNSFLTLKVYGPARTEAGQDVEANIGQETETLGLEGDPAKQAGTYYISLGLAQNTGGLGQREFKTELVLAVDNG